MITLKEALVKKSQRLNRNYSNSILTRKRAIQYCRDYMKDLGESTKQDFDNKYENASEVLIYMCGCKDREISKMAENALNIKEQYNLKRYEIYISTILNISSLI